MDISPVLFICFAAAFLKHTLKIDAHVALMQVDIGFGGELVLFAGYFKALSSTFLRAALPRSMPHTSDSLTRYSKTSESSSPRIISKGLFFPANQITQWIENSQAVFCRLAAA
nr:hypothetical protein Iba_chr12eCG13350 [Ipomoea batatas]